MSIIDRYLARGWRFARKGAELDRRRIVCPNAGCGLTLSINQSAKPSTGAVAVDDFTDFTVAIVDRRVELGLTADDLDHVAGMTCRHTQKIEDAGRRMGEGRSNSEQATLTSLIKSLDGVDLPPDVAADLAILAARALAKKDGDRPRIPKLDTVFLMVEALGGRIKIEWGEPPRMARRLSKLAGQNRQIGLWN